MLSIMHPDQASRLLSAHECRSDKHSYYCIVCDWLATGRDIPFILRVALTNTLAGCGRNRPAQSMGAWNPRSEMERHGRGTGNPCTARRNGSKGAAQPCVSHCMQDEHVPEGQASVSWLKRRITENEDLSRLRVLDRQLVAGDVVAAADGSDGQVPILRFAMLRSQGFQCCANICNVLGQCNASHVSVCNAVHGDVRGAKHRTL